MPLRQPHVTQRGFQSFSNNSAVAEPDLIHACESIRRHSVPASVDDKDSDARKSRHRFPTPLFDKLWWHHRKTGERARAGMCEHASKRDERFSGPAFRNGRSASRLQPTLHDPHDGHGLRWKGTPLQLRESWPARVAGAMQRRKA
jgi:hypothetical protein